MYNYVYLFKQILMYSLILNDPIQFITYNLIKGDELKVILIITNNCSLEINYSHEYLQGI